MNNCCCPKYPPPPSATTKPINYTPGPINGQPWQGAHPGINFPTPWNSNIFGEGGAVVGDFFTLTAGCHAAEDSTTINQAISFTPQNRLLLVVEYADVITNSTCGTVDCDTCPSETICSGTGAFGFSNGAMVVPGTVVGDQGVVNISCGPLNRCGLGSPSIPYAPGNSFILELDETSQEERFYRFNNPGIMNPDALPPPDIVHSIPFAMANVNNLFFSAQDLGVASFGTISILSRP